MGTDLESSLTEVLLLLDRVASEPELVSNRALELVNEAETALDAEFLALAQRCYGLALRGCGLPQKALLWIQKSVDSALEGGLHSVAASSRLALSSTLSMAGDFAAALQSTEAALPLLPANEVSAALSRRALFLQRLERTQEAIVAHDEAVERATSDNQTLELAKSLNNRGLFRVDLGDMRGATSDLLESSKLFLDLGLLETSASIDHNVGWCLARQGLVVEALVSYDRSDKKGGLGNSATWVGAFDRAEVYVSARLLPEALHAAKHSYRLAKEAGFESEVPVISLQLGRIQSALGDAASAEDCFATAETRFRDQGRSSSAEVALRCRLLVTEKAPTEPLLISFSSTGDDPHGHRDTLVDVAYGELLRLRFGSQPLDPNKMAALESILEGGMESTNSLTRVQSCAARLAIRTDQSTPRDVPQTAVEEVAEQLFSELENHLEGIHSQELRTVGVDRLELEALFCSAAIALHDPHTFELWIGRLRSAISTPTRSDLSELVELNTLREPNAGPQRNALEFAVRSSHWTSRPTSLGSANNIEPFQPLVTPEKGQVVLMYAQDGTNVVVSIITDHSQTIETVGSLKDIRTRSQSVCLGAAGLFGSRAGGTKRGEERAASLLRAIDQLQVLVLPVSLPSGDVLISTTGSLGTVPWYLFPRLVARSITLTTSSGRRLNTPGEATPNRVRVGIVEGPGLDHGAGEVDAVAEFYNDPIILRGTQATVQAVSDLLTSTDLVHVVAHGRRRIDNALFSGIELVDGPLMAYDIERLRSTPQTVVLSCCDLGAANSQGAFGLLGFSGALVSRGTSQVAAAVLPVSDEMSKAVMVRLHDAIKKGRAVSQAVADAVANAESLFERVTAGSYVVKGP